jgi:hypothetical protein
MSTCTLPGLAGFVRLVSNRGSDGVGYKNREPNTRSPERSGSGLAHPGESVLPFPE